MRTMRVLPERDQVPALLPPPGSVTWRYASDARILAAAGYALMLQVAHPTVGAGVREHSNFAADPWGRLLRTLDYVNLTVYGGPDLAADTGRRIRLMHRRIRGVLPDGRRYSALEPEAYAWGHCTLAAGIVHGHRRFGRPLDPEQTEALWAEWRRLGRVIGVRERDLPASWAAFEDYFALMVSQRLVNNPTVHEVLAALRAPTPPPLPGVGGRGWRLASVPPAKLLELATVGLMPPLLRERLGLEWTAAQERRLRALGRASRAATPLLPDAVRVYGPRYLRWRRSAGRRAAAPIAVRAAT
ncbi:MAG: oxygenase MpaB family protein [Solirubrobacteraceae bacterium]